MYTGIKIVCGKQMMHVLKERSVYIFMFNFHKNLLYLFIFHSMGRKMKIGVVIADVASYFQ